MGCIGRSGTCAIERKAGKNNGKNGKTWGSGAVHALDFSDAGLGAGTDPVCAVLHPKKAEKNCDRKRQQNEKRMKKTEAKSEKER